MDIEKLIEELEGAEVGRFELDRQIWISVKPPGVEIRDHLPKPYTTSVDAALGLVPEGWVYHVDATAPPMGIAVEMWGPDNQGDFNSKGDAATLPLAICIAALKARKEKE